MSGFVSSSAQATDNELVAKVNHQVTLTHKAQRLLKQPLTPWAHHHTAYALRQWTAHARVWVPRTWNPRWIIKAEFGPTLSPMALCIAKAESGLRPTAYNPSSAAGLFQMMSYWYSGASAYGWVFDPFNAWQNAHHARLLHDLSGGWSQWYGDPCVS